MERKSDVFDSLDQLRVAMISLALLWYTGAPSKDRCNLCPLMPGNVGIVDY